MIYLILLLVVIALYIALSFMRSNRRMPRDKNTPQLDDVEGFLDTLTVPPPPPLPPAPASAPKQEKEMAQFHIAYPIVKVHEGDYQDNKEDTGNYNSLGKLVGTNWGINAQVYERYLKRPPTVQDVMNMPRHIAVLIFKQLYWDTIQGDKIYDQQVANIFFDGHVNHGRWGIQMMQQALGITRDGVVGPITLNAINTANQVVLFNRYKAIRRAGYLDLIRRKPDHVIFRRGWLKRIDSFFYRATGRKTPLSETLPQVNVTATRLPKPGGDAAILVAVAGILTYLLTK